MRHYFFKVIGTCTFIKFLHVHVLHMEATPIPYISNMFFTNLQYMYMYVRVGVYTQAIAVLSK